MDTQTDESYLQNAEELDNSFLSNMEQGDGHDDDMDWIPDSDDEEQYSNDSEEINPAKERKYVLF